MNNQDKLAQALQPFVIANSSEEFVTLIIRSSDITKAREAIAAHEATQAAPAPATPPKAGSVEWWLKAALDCKQFAWDADQAECAERVLADRMALLAAQAEAVPANHIADSRNMVPQGWKLVPVEPPPEMLSAAYDRMPHFTDDPEPVWFAMLAAAPQPPAAQPLTDEQIDDIADAHRWDTREGRRQMIRSALAGQTQPQGLT